VSVTLATHEELAVRPESKRNGRVRTGNALRKAGALVATLAAMTAVWQLLVWVLEPPEIILPAPLAVARQIGQNWPLLVDNMWPTLAETLGGFGLSIALGIPLGILLSRPYRVCRALEPFMLATQVFPKIAVAPLFIIWFGFGITPKILFVLLLTFFPITIATMDGFRSVPQDMRNLVNILGMSTLRRLASVEFPWALPQIFTGLKVSASFGITAAIVYEFIGSSSGLGYIIKAAQANLGTPLMFSALIFVSFLGFLFYGVVSAVERISIPWHISQRSSQG
jgi:NitT/TauT family transport system permease protein